MTALLCLAALVAPSSAPAREAAPGADGGLQIQHEPVACLVAGKYPRLLACFSPPPQLARARVFFRAHGTADWYYVNMAEDGPCFAGVLPRPTAAIERVDYYFEATSREFAESLTQELDARVVEDEAECEGILAPFLDKAKVIVGAAPGVGGIPQGFAGGGLSGVGLPAVAGILGAAAAVGGIAIAGGGGEAPARSPVSPPLLGPEPGPTPAPTPTPEPTPTPGPAPGAGPTPAPTPEPTPPPESGPTPPPESGPTPPPESNEPPTGKFNVNPKDITSGQKVNFNMCASSDLEGDPLAYAVEYGDGDSYAGTDCHAKHRYTAPDGTARLYDARVCVTDGKPGHDPDCRTYVIRVEGDGFLEGTTSQGDPVEDLRPTTPAPSPDAAPTGPSGDVVLDSQLTVPGGTGQIVLNGSESFFVGTGRSRLGARGLPEANRVEALLVDGKGAAGQWRFDLSATRRPVEGLRVVAGQTVSVSPREVVFALSGRPAERIVFSFELPPAP